MTVKKRNVAIVSLVLLLCAMSVVVGFYLGYERALRVSVTPVIGANALLHKSLLSLLANKNIDGARQQLNVMLDGEIIELHAYQAGLPDGELKRAGIQTLTRIAEYRRKHPSDNPSNPEVDKKVKDILGRVLSADRDPKDQAN